VGGGELPYCEKCGGELKGDEAFCPRCGASVALAEARARSTPREERDVGWRRRRAYRRERQACFGGGGGLWGAISGGVFLVGLGILWYLNWWWPGILFLLGIMILVGGLAGYWRRPREI